MPQDADKKNPEPTLRSIAKIAGVTATTVSMALRHHQRIPKGTRLRIQTIAKNEGYIPDPALNKLMQHLRKRQTSRLLKGSICALRATEWGNVSTHYSGVILEAARFRAQALGFSFDIVGLEEVTATAERMRRILRNRGVEGVLVLPLPKPMEIPNYAEWENFSVVAASYSVLKPNFHKVVPHQFNNTLSVCRRLVDRGYRRIGLIINRTYEARVNHNCSAAVSWQSLLGGTEFVRPLLFGMSDRAEAEEWFADQQPDSIIVSGDTLDAMGVTGVELHEAWRVPVICTSWFSGQRCPGMNERPQEIGTKSVDVLASMILRSEKGVPVIPSVTMVEGELHGFIPKVAAEFRKHLWRQPERRAVDIHKGLDSAVENVG